MSFKINFLDNTSTDYYADDFNRQMKSIVKNNGVSTSTDLKVSANVPSDLTVKVSSGSAWVDGMFVTSDAEISVTIPLNTSGGTVIHVIYLIVDIINKSASIAISTTATEANKIKVKLAQISMTNTNTKVESGQITDLRSVVTFATASDISTIDSKISNIINGNTKVASATNANYATTAGSAASATNATNATKANTATTAGNSTSWNNMQLRSGSSLTGVNGYITFTW